MLLVSGCIPEVRQGFDSPDPNLRLKAIIDAASEGEDAEVIPRLIDRLESTDPAARMLASRALEQRTGETRGYHHTDPVWKRQAAVRAWQSWWREEARVEPEPTPEAVSANEEAPVG